MLSKYQLNSSRHRDNSKLASAANDDQINNISCYCHHFAQYYQHFIMKCYEIAPNACLSKLQIIENPNDLAQVISEITTQGYVFIDTISDFTTSYKGWISWISIAFNNKGYLIDAIALHKEINHIKFIVQNRNIIKFSYRQCILLQDVKRQWDAFGVNFFDFELFEKSIGVNKHLNIFPNQLSIRPIVAHLYEQLQQRYNNMVKYLAQIRYYLQKETSDYSLYGYSNHYQPLLKEYRHMTYSFQHQQKQYLHYISQAQKMAKEDKQNNFNSNTLIDQPQNKKDHIINSQRDKNLCQLFINWRQHMSRILDCPPRELLTFSEIVTIVHERPSSILEVQDILCKDKIQTFQLASKILQILAYESQITQNAQNVLQIRNTRRKEEKNIKSLLSQLKWDDRQEWLNRRNDQSIRLYKQIVSIVQFDASVVEQFAEGMTKGPVGKAEIGRFVKYAQYLRSGNHRRLKEYYQSCPLLESEQDKQDCLDGWQSQEQYSFIIKKPSTSLTSIAGSSQKLPDKVELNTVSTIKGTNSSYSLGEELQSSLVTTKIQPLPQNIEEIYLKAVSVKKGYQKVQKKKGGRKQGKQQNEQFVPSWDQIKQLIQI